MHHHFETFKRPPSIHAQENPPALWVSRRENPFISSLFQTLHADLLAVAVSRASCSLIFLSLTRTHTHAKAKKCFDAIFSHYISHQVEMSQFERDNNVRIMNELPLTFCAVDAFWFVLLLTVFKPLSNLARVVRFLFVSRPSAKWEKRRGNQKTIHKSTRLLIAYQIQEL
jgi:hypothetical protein